MSLGQSMNISVNSMKNNQYALTVVSHNIANLHTDGYHRQRVNFQESPYTTTCENILSTIKGMNGAYIASLSDFIDQGAFNGLINSNSDANYYNTLANALGELENVADDLGEGGLSSLLNDFYKAAANLEQFPSDMTIRQQYVLAAQNVCEKFNDISKKYDNIQEDKFISLNNDTAKINGLLEKLALANEAHVKNNQNTATQVEINSILQELSNYMDISTDKNVNGTVNLYIGGIAVVQGCKQQYKLNLDLDSNNPENSVQFSLQSLEKPDYVVKEGVTDSFKAGSMKAYIDFLNGSNSSFSNVNDMKNALDSAANAFLNALNDIQTFNDGDIFAASITQDDDGNLILEQATQKMLVGSGAGDISVNQAIVDNPFLVSAARIDLNKYKDEDGNIDPNWVKSIGNSDNATKITALQNAKICSYGNGKNNCTLSQFLINNAAKNGMDLADIQNKADIYQDILDNDTKNYANMVGVNLDEELADMIKYQRAFEASAKMFSTINDLMGTIINMV